MTEQNSIENADHIFIIHLSVDGHPGWCHFLTYEKGGIEYG